MKNEIELYNKESSLILKITKSNTNSSQVVIAVN